MRARLLAFPMAIVMAVAAAGAVMAWPADSIKVETSGCTYTIVVDQDRPDVLIGWEVRVAAASPHDGALIDSGSGTADSEGHFAVGPLTAEPGEYTALVDYSFPVTASAEVVPFTLACETASVMPSGQPSEAPPASVPPASVAPSETPTDTPSGGEGPASASPTGGQLGAVGTPGLTPPPTDSTPATSAGAGSDGVRTVVLLLASLIIAALVAARAATPATRKR